MAVIYTAATMYFLTICPNYPLSKVVRFQLLIALDGQRTESSSSLSLSSSSCDAVYEET